MSLASGINDLATRIGAEVKAVWSRLTDAPYVIYIDETARTFPAIPNPRPARVITFNATRLLDFDPNTELPTPTTHPQLEVGDIVEFYYEEP